ncbi:hypothetical protein DTO282F9_2352 [Paecilomyces variotii]|nr:hypothetical protein DTO282F9_2352 [Paecilomyces variotii]
MAELRCKGSNKVSTWEFLNSHGRPRGMSKTSACPLGKQDQPLQCFQRRMGYIERLDPGNEGTKSNGPMDSMIVSNFLSRSVLQHT